MCSCTLSALERASPAIRALNEGQKVSFDLENDPRKGKVSGRQPEAGLIDGLRRGWPFGPPPATDHRMIGTRCRSRCRVSS